jgi:DnaJ-class molecular chaperone
MIVKDYYSVLGLSHDARHDEIRRAFYQSVKRNHPDVNPSSEATQKLLDTIEAHEMLCDPTKKAIYDAILSGILETSQKDINLKEFQQWQKECAQKARQYAGMSLEEYMRLKQEWETKDQARADLTVELATVRKEW